MVDEKKLRLMTRLVQTKKHESRKIFTGRAFYGSDYVAFRLITGILGLAVAYAVIVGLIILSQEDTVLRDITLTDFVTYLLRYVAIFAVLLVVFILYIVFSSVSEYLKSKEGLEEYGKALKDVNDYDKEKNKK